MVRPGAHDPRQSRQRAFHDAKYAVFRALCQDWQRYRDMMRDKEGC